MAQTECESGGTPAGPPAARDYQALAIKVSHEVQPDMDREARMRVVVDVLWEGLNSKGVSWIGFYLKEPHADEMVLGPRRDKPACSPIGMHGACGRCFLRDAPLVVRDVQELGEHYIACDPRDRSEVVLPCYDAGPRPIGVLDLDSFDVQAFDERDAAGLTAVLAAARMNRQATSGR